MIRNRTLASPTDDALRYAGDPNLDGQSDVADPASLTHGVKSPRLLGLWALKRFLHNGSVDSLEALFCLDSPRPTNETFVFADTGHMQTCDGLSDADKRALIAYLETL